MPVIPVNFAQVNYKLGGSALPRGAEVVLGILPPTGTDATTIATACATSWTSTMRGYTGSSVVLESVLAKKGPNSTGAFAEVAVGSACTGSGQVDPPQICFNIKKSTAYGGRRGSGRMYLPCPSEGSVDDGGLVNASALTVLQGLVTNFYNALLANFMIPVVLHNDVITPPYPVLGFTIEPRVATQKRRNRIRF